MLLTDCMSTPFIRKDVFSRGNDSVNRGGPARLHRISHHSFDRKDLRIASGGEACLFLDRRDSEEGHLIDDRGMRESASTGRLAYLASESMLNKEPVSLRQLFLVGCPSLS